MPFSLFEPRFLSVEMIIDLNTLSSPETPFSYEVSAGSVDLGDEPAAVNEPLSFSGLVRSADELEIIGSIKGSMMLECTRCLTAVPRPIDIAFTDTFRTAEEMSSDSETGLAPTELTADVLPDGTLDLGEVLREQLILSIPAQTFCKDDCKGLCGRCGANLNLGECRCENDDIDPRWAALKELK